MRLLRRSSLRYAGRHGWQTALSILGVGLGVAVVLAVDLAVSSARRGFTLSAEAVAGRATHQIVAGPLPIPDTAYARLRAVPGVAAAAPVVDGEVVVGSVAGGGSGGGSLLRLLGVDPFAEGRFRRYPGGPEGGPALIGERGGLLARATADRLGLAVGDWMALEVSGRPDSLRLLGVLDGDAARRDGGARGGGSASGLEGLVVADIATAQAVLGRAGLDRVDLILEAGVDTSAIQEALPRGSYLRPAAAEADALAEMTRAFDLNLRALSLLALVFGVFLIYNSVTFSVVQRRRLLGTLRALGATRRQVFGLVTGEALVLGLVGAGVGVALGVALGSGLLRLVTRTIQDLYFVVAVRDLALGPATLAKAVGLGVAGTVAAAIPAAAEAAAAHPGSALVRSTLETGLRRRLPAVSAAGVVLALAGGVVLGASTGVTGSFVGLFGVIIGAALLTPVATVGLMRALRPVAGGAFGILGRMAAGGVTAGLSRTGPAVAALTIAVSVTVGVAVMIGSFRGSVERWLGVTLSADVYVAPPRSGGWATRMDPAAVGAIAGDPEVVLVRRYRRALVPSEAGDVQLMAIEVDSLVRGQLTLLDGDLAAAWDDFEAGRAALVSEPFAYRRGLGAGDTIRLVGPGGEAALPVGAVYRDYGSDLGVVMLSLVGYRSRWQDTTVSTLALGLAPGADPSEVMERLRARTAPVQPLTFRSDRLLAEASLAVFDRTFAITQVLRLLALIVAFVGVLSALMALQLERARELGVLRANGLTPGQVWALVASQTGLMGLASGLMAVPLGLLLAWLMIEFVNRRSFGWSIDFAASPAVLLQALALAVGASLLAGLYPSWRMARTSPAEALRSE